ncbi:hypothetical protein TNCV_4871181 [Trichonephila clavipes]|nr:hypothetical protein TNCV_4871181 [Trichonephila clavipes]
MIPAPILIQSLQDESVSKWTISCRKMRGRFAGDISRTCGIHMQCRDPHVSSQGRNRLHTRTSSSSFAQGRKKMRLGR